MCFNEFYESINKDDLKKFPLTNLNITVGKTGIEETYENTLVDSQLCC